MDTFYIFQYCSNVKDKNNYTLCIFCSGCEISRTVLRDRLKEFLERNRPPQKVLLIGSKLLKDTLTEILKTSNEVLDVIPNFLVGEKEKNVLLFDSNGELKYVTGKDFEQSEQFMKEGIYNIFRTREGLIRAASDNYHFIFPSGKHSQIFIRAGNVLIHGAEIYFIALAILKYLKPKTQTIYCDTSSINSLAFAAIELKKRFSSDFVTPAVISFGSYDQFEAFEFRDSRNSLILISATTSGKLVEILLTKHPSLKADNILSLFYLSRNPTKSQIICDLTFDENKFPAGIENDTSKDNDIDCKFCDAGSYPVKITGDIFLLEKPKIHSITIKKKDRPTWLNDFMRKFYSHDGVHFLRCYFGEEPKRRFEIYFKGEEVLNNLQTLNNSPHFETDFTNKLKKLQHQITPATLQKIVYLEDEGSRVLAYQMRDMFHPNLEAPISVNSILAQSDEEIEIHGAILVVCSNLVTGNSLLYVNKYLRRFKNMSRTFFVLFARPESDSAFEFIRSNISQGEFGPNTNQFVYVEKLTCPFTVENPNGPIFLSWTREIDVLKTLISNIEESGNFKEALVFLKSRLEVLENSSDSNAGGLINEVFLRNPINGKQLKINRSFAFFDFEEYHDQASQADIYFTIAAIINQLRHSKDGERKIIQEEHVRTVINPENFNRYDDGIIQASILRSAKPTELNYKFEISLSSTMTSILLKMVKNYKDELTSEGLLEFLLALSIRKLKIYDSHLREILDSIDASVGNDTVLIFSKFLREKIYSK
jgi:hypothetical protein